MATFKSFANVVLDMLQNLRLTQPSLDTKPGSVARDLFIENQAFEISTVYDVLRELESLQSIANLSGTELVNYGANFGVEKKTGTKAVGTAVFTFRSIDTDIPINAGSIVRTRRGTAFITVSTVVARTSQINALRATATRLRQELNTANITDEFAIEVSVEAQGPGTSGNIAEFSLISHSVPSVNSVTNVSPFTGGTDAETDAAFRSRILGTFAGANIGTSLGYRSVVLALPDTIDALVVEPGDVLMTRDGTTVTTNSNGDTIISSPGTGGKVDIYIMGENRQSTTDSFVYNDVSGKQDPTDSDNDFIMGQSSLTADTSLTLNSRRLATFAGADIPNQPVIDITSVSGSSSGPNFVEQFADSAGNLQGNYKLVKDTSATSGGSPFGLDKFVWTSDRIELTNESRNKGPFNGIDALAFTDVLATQGVRQDVQVTNENSSVSSNRQYITVNHKPVRTVSRVFNLTTGERYTIADQTPDDTGNINTTGRIQINGSTLPTASDVLQVDYIWIRELDKYIDFDNLDPQDRLNEAQDSVDWGFSNYIRAEDSIANLDSYGNLTVRTDLPISRVISVNTFISETAVVVQSQTNKTIQVSTPITNIFSIKDSSLTGTPEVYNTELDDGDFSNLLITLPSDTLAVAGDTVTVLYNFDDITDVDGYDSGLFINNEITLLPSTIVSSGTSVKVDYVADYPTLIPSTNIAELPISTDGYNSFVGLDGYQTVFNIFNGPTVVSNQRRSPSQLRVTTNNIPNQGTLRIAGTTINKVTHVFTATSSGDISLASSIRSAEGFSSTQTIPSNISIARVVSVESVTLSTSNEVSGVNVEHDLTNYGIKSAKWDRENAIEISGLAATSVRLASTSANTTSPVLTGTILRVVFYYAKANDTEDLFYSRSGLAVTDKVFGHINLVDRISGFKDSGGTVIGSLTVQSFNQPTEGSNYFVDYDYLAPKENERITINYEYNQLIVDATNAIEDNRPITADVLAKAATEVELDVQVKIVISSDFLDQEATVKQDVADNITASLTASQLGTTLDASDIINNVYDVAGVDRVRIIKFNKTGVSGTKLSITAQKNEYLSSGSVTVEVETR